MNFFNIIISMAVIAMVRITVAAPAYDDYEQLEQLEQPQQRFARKIYSDDYYNGNGIDREDLRPSVSPPKFKYRPIYQYKHTETKRNKNHKLYVLNVWGWTEGKNQMHSTLAFETDLLFTFNFTYKLRKIKTFEIHFVLLVVNLGQLSFLNPSSSILTMKSRQ